MRRARVQLEAAAQAGLALHTLWSCGAIAIGELLKGSTSICMGLRSHTTAVVTS